MAGELNRCISVGYLMRDAHRNLRQRVRQIHEDLSAVLQQARQEPFDQMVNDLDALCADLSHHFSEEEDGGCLEEAVTRQPHLTRTLTQLEHEHVTLLNELKQLIERAEQVRDEVGSLERLVTDFGSFTNSLEAHEATEDRLLEEGLGIPAE